MRSQTCGSNRGGGLNTIRIMVGQWTISGQLQ